MGYTLTASANSGSLTSLPSSAFNITGARFSVANNIWSLAGTTWARTSGGSATGVPAPDAVDAVTIEAGHTVTVDLAGEVCASMQLGSAAANNTGMINFAATGSPSLTVSGAVKLGGAAAAQTGTITFNYSGATLTAGSLTLGGSAGPGTITMTAGGTLIVGGAITVNTVAGNTWTPGTGTVQLTAINTLPATIFTSFNNLTIEANTTLGTSTTIGGTLTLTGGTLTVGANTLTLNGPAIAGTPANLSTTSSSSLVFGGSSAGLVFPAA